MWKSSCKPPEAPVSQTLTTQASAAKGHQLPGDFLLVTELELHQQEQLLANIERRFWWILRLELLMTTEVREAAK